LKDSFEISEGLFREGIPWEFIGTQKGLLGDSLGIPFGFQGILWELHSGLPY
jgi:hypothetical protein